MDLTVIARCMEDRRVFSLIDSIRKDIDPNLIVVTTPDAEILRTLSRMEVTTVIAPKGNPAQSTILGLQHTTTRYVMLVDSDCELMEDTLQRICDRINESPTFDFILPRIRFEHNSISSYLTAAQRLVQYQYRLSIYEPGLVIDLKNALPKIGGYLFDRKYKFTPDGELDFRAYQIGKSLLIERDKGVTLTHAALPFLDNLRSHVRYAESDKNLPSGQYIKFYLNSLPLKYLYALQQEDYNKAAALAASAVCDTIYTLRYLL